MNMNLYPLHVRISKYIDVLINFIILNIDKNFNDTDTNNIYFTIFDIFNTFSKILLKEVKSFNEKFKLTEIEGSILIHEIKELNSLNLKIFKNIEKCNTTRNRFEKLYSQTKLIDERYKEILISNIAKTNNDEEYNKRYFVEDKPEDNTED